MNWKINFCKMILVISLGLFLMSCGGGIPLSKGEGWLDSKKDTPTINISGNWDSPEWGRGKFKQENRDMEGVLGDYPVKGVVSGNTVYLLMYSDKKVDYSAELSALDKDTFKGFYSKYSIVEEEKNKKPINLKRLK